MGMETFLELPKKSCENFGEASGHQSPAKRLSFLPLDSGGIPLKFLIQVHHSHSNAASLPENLGDGFLYATNAVYRIVRDEYLARGFTFTTVDFCNYNAFPLMALDELTDAGKIPYLPNFSWIEKIYHLSPDKFTCSELLRFGLKSNYLLHESAHLIAHDELFGRSNLRAIPKNSATLLRILAGEAFANSVEAFSSAFSSGTFGPFFLAANSYFSLRGQRLKDLNEFISRYGSKTTFRALFACFLYANFLYGFLEEMEFERVCAFAGIAPSPSVKKIADIAFPLSIGFRTNTTPLHLFKIGFGPELQSLFELDPLAYLSEKENAVLLARVDALLRLVAS